MTDFWDVDALLAEPEEEEKEILTPSEVVAVPSIEVVRHNLLALIQQALEGRYIHRRRGTWSQAM